MSTNLLEAVTGGDWSIAPDSECGLGAGLYVAASFDRAAVGAETSRTVAYAASGNPVDAQLIALAYDHALQFAAMREGLMVIGGAMRFAGRQTSYPVAIGKGGGLNTVLYPDAFGCLAIPAGEFGDKVRAALRAALGLK